MRFLALSRVFLKTSVHAACPDLCYVSMSMLHVPEHATPCLRCMPMPMLHVRVYAACPCPYCMDLSMQPSYTCSIDIDIHYGRGHAVWTRNAAQTWTRSMHWDMQHGHKHAAWAWTWTWKCGLDASCTCLCCMSMSMLHLLVHVHVNVYAAFPCLCCMSMSMLHVHVMLLRLEHATLTWT